MSTYQTKNYTAHGGSETVIGGTLTINGTLAIGDGATVTGLSANPLQPATADSLGGVKVGSGLSIENGVLSADVTEVPVAEAQADSEATTVAALKENFNALLAKLRTAGLMAADDEDDDDE